ncbi:hypothetical protein [Acetivibrio mesophilus]|uniref:Lipoprotein n=1 Tax=Acetivibrio mesophilus TaxID=2487273 RepID=A0A4Q0IBT0_9FIRM|nr:hypothetical protein [Acetivibrio mesophilus]RXE60562.1 hypothetical protein EFD62_01100 [Acetivibrio mesophilus]
MNKKSLLLIFLCFILILTGCSNGAPSYTDFVIPKGDESNLVPVDSYQTSQQKTYTNEGITPTYIAEYKSENELCSIIVYKEYYDVTLDYENGTPGEVGTAYAEMILKVFPDYPQIMEPIFMKISGLHLVEILMKHLQWKRECIPSLKVWIKGTKKN